MTDYKVQAGDTYSSISARYGVSVSAIQQANKNVDPKKLQIGQMLTMPNKTAVQNNDQNSVKGSAQNAVKNNGQKSSVTNPFNNSDKHIIQSGDTLSGIAKERGISLAELIKANPGVKPTKLRPGQSINLVSKEKSTSDNKVCAEKKNEQIEIDLKKALKGAINESVPDEYNMKLPFGLNAKPTEGIKPVVKTDATSKTSEKTENQEAIKEAEEKKAAVFKKAENHVKGKEKFRAKVYTCTSGRSTIGYGHRIIEGENYKAISQKQANELLHKDMEKAYDGICKALGDSAKKLNASQLAALTSMTFNSGLNAVKKSEYFALIKEGKFEEAQAKMDAVYGNKTRNGKIVCDTNGKPVKEIKNGLLIRRIEEMKMFGGGKLGEPAKKRILELINESYETKYKSLEEAAKDFNTKFKQELDTLERKNTCKSLPKKEKSKLAKLRNMKDLFKIINNTEQNSMASR